MISVQASPITSPPIITVQPLNLAASPGQTITFTNVAYGSPDVAIQWYGIGTPRAATTTTVPTATPTNYLSTLTLADVSTNDVGLYYLVLSNNFGSVTSKLAALTFGSIVSGMVSDATETTTNGVAVGIPGVLVSVGNVQAVTDQDGNYELVGVSLGSLYADFMADKTYAHLNEPVQFWDHSSSTAARLTATKDGYYEYDDDQFAVGQGQTVQERFTMTPIFDGLRFVLTWTNVPADLDLLLHFPPSVPVDYPWIDYLPTNRGSITQPPEAILDVSTVTGWGPDTITIHKFYPGTYSLYANKFQGQGGATCPNRMPRSSLMSAATSPDLRPHWSLPEAYGCRRPAPMTGGTSATLIRERSAANTHLDQRILPTPPGASLTNGVDVILRGGRSPGRLPAPHRRARSTMPPTSGISAMAAGSPTYSSPSTVMPTQVGTPSPCRCLFCRTI